MQAQLIHRAVIQNKSFNIKSHCHKNFLQVWHYHPEYELICILEGTGTRFIGDSIQKFSSGEFILIGKNMPHMWMYDKIYFRGDPLPEARSLVVHFHEDFIDGLSKIPEMVNITSLFSYADQGIKFDGATNGALMQKMEAMVDLHGYDKLMALLDVLKQLTDQKQHELLSSPGYVNAFNDKKDGKIVAVYEYVMNNFREGVDLNRAASVANMNPSAFSRYFKQIHKKTFITFVNEIKIGYACKLLLEQKYSISQICYESGFNNISNFNRQFKSYKQMTPTKYIKLHCGTG